MTMVSHFPPSLSSSIIGNYDPSLIPRSIVKSRRCFGHKKGIRLQNIGLVFSNEYYLTNDPCVVNNFIFHSPLKKPGSHLASGTEAAQSCIVSIHNFVLLLIMANCRSHQQTLIISLAIIFCSFPYFWNLSACARRESTSSSISLTFCLP